MNYDLLLPILRECCYPHTVAELHRMTRGNIKALDNRIRSWSESGVVVREKIKVGNRPVWGCSVK